MKSRKKLILFFIILLIALAAIGVTVLYNNKPSYEGIVRAGVDSKVIIRRTKTGIPVVKAGTRNDAYFSIGFLHYQDRQPLIEYFRAVASGRLSEVIGSDGRFMDRLSLTIGFSRKAENILSKLSGTYNDYLVSYVRGINASRKINGQGPLSGFSFREWTIKDVISILLLFDWADALQNNRELILPVREGASRHLTDIIPQDILYQFGNEEKDSLDLLLKMKEEVKKRVGLYQSGFAFYLDSKNLKDGKAVSGFTLDSNAGIYPKWYQLRLIMGDDTLDCITASGLPFLLYGKNKDITYFGFNLRMDSQSFRIEKIRKINDTEKYYRNREWHNFETASEKLYSDYLEDIDEYMEVTARSTDNGPVISDIADKVKNIYCISMNSIFPDESYVKSLFDIPFAGSVSEGFNLVRFINSVPKGYLFCSKDDAVCAYSGKVIKDSNMELFLKDNTPVINSGMDLSAYSRYYKNRNIIIGSEMIEDMPAFIFNKSIHSEDNRFSRFKELIDKQSPLEPHDIALILKDTRSLLAEKFTPLFISILEQYPIPSAKLCRIYFEEWDYNLDSDSTAAAIFEVLVINLLKETLADEMADKAMIADNYSFLTDNLYRLMSDGKTLLFDNINTNGSIETKEIIFDRAFIKTLRFLNKKFGPVMDNWKWGKLHRENIIIPLLKDSLLHFYYNRKKKTEFPGGNNTVMKGSVDAFDLFKPVSISSISGIFYIDLNLFFLTDSGSQSLNPSSEFYRDFSVQGDFIGIDMSDLIYTYTILPDKG